MSEPGKHPPETPSIQTTEEVMFFDTDCGGVVHNLAYLRMIETARTRLAGVMGLNLRSMAQTQEYPVVVRTEIDYRKPAQLGDFLQIHGELDLLERARFWMRFRVVRDGGGELLIECRQQLALVKMPGGKPLRLPDQWRIDFQHLYLPGKRA